MIAIVERYFSALREVHQLGAGTKERSYYPAVAELLNAIGQELSPKVFCLSDLGNTGAGHPDFGLFAASQLQRGEPRRGQVPERGVIEMKSVSDDAWVTADTAQVTKYFGAYRLVIVSNTRDFLIVGEGSGGLATKLESFRLASDEKAFWDLVATPRKSAERVGCAFGEFLMRALTQSVALREPRDLAWFLASYARDGLARVESAGDLPALANVRQSLEAALGVTFDQEKGEHFFRSTLVQTLFYGVFSAWVLWAREVPRASPRFDWHAAVWHLTVPFIRTLFQQLASPAQLQPLRLVELLDWTAATLNRVDTTEFFSRFDDADAVQFFYEPFLEAFDPELRKQLGVWYTPNEVVTYMVARVDKALREDLGVADGLASENVYVLDPCCGTGAYLAAVLRRIDATLAEGPYGALRGQLVKKAALERVFGFEIMPAPFVVAHLQVGLVLRSLGSTMDADHERAGIYLTNALTGWEPTTAKPLPFPELEDERRRADSVKQDTPILVILGNPPYNGYAGVAVEEERELSNAYRTTRKVRRPSGHGLNDLYVRFFRMAERRIVDKTGQGIVSFITNFEWLHGLSHPGMRERFLEAFDAIRIDNLNGDSRETGKLTPEGLPDPSIFSTEYNREGIRKGTAISLLVRKLDHQPAVSVAVRQLWGTEKRQELAASGESDPKSLYENVVPVLEMGLPFVRMTISAGYNSWPKLPELLPSYFAGVQTKRDGFLIDHQEEALRGRIASYFDEGLSDEDLKILYPDVWKATARYDPVATRRELLERGSLDLKEHIVKHAYRPFDTRWLYWEPDTKLLGEKSPSYWPHGRSPTLTLVAQQKPRGEWCPPYVVSSLGSLDLMDRSASLFPVVLRDEATKHSRQNISRSLLEFLNERGLEPEAVLQHILATVHAPTYRVENLDALQLDWPRVPIPSGAEALRLSAELGTELAGYLDAEAVSPGVSIGPFRPGLRTLGVPTKLAAGSLTAEDLKLTVGWGAIQGAGSGNSIVMPGRGHVPERDFTDDELAALELEATALELTPQVVQAALGMRTVDVYMNENALWKNVPVHVWDYSLGGYQVLKKWLSYREQAVLGRGLTPEEGVYFSEMVRRIAAALLMGHSLDANYTRAKATAVEWVDGRPKTPPPAVAGTTTTAVEQLT